MPHPHPLASIVKPGSTVLWVASSGGHFAQLRRIAASTEASQGSKWITFETPQTVDVLNHQDVHYVDYISPRDGRKALRASMWAMANLKRGLFDICISTGAALAPAVLPIAKVRGYRTVYIESITRVDGPSLSGRMLAGVPGVETYTQHVGWSSSKWQYLGSILDGWKAKPANQSADPRKIFVTLGSIKPYRFDRAIDAVLAILAPGDEVVWQLGATDRDDLPGDVTGQVSPTQFMQYIANADVVVTHAGVGTVMEMLDLGIAPVIAVRESKFGEHVDDHQRQIATELVRRGLVYELDLVAPSRADIENSYRTTVVQC